MVMIGDEKTMMTRGFKTTVLPMLLGAAVGLTVTVPQAVHAEATVEETIPQSDQQVITVVVEDEQVQKTREAETRLLAKLVHAEAGNQDRLGKQLVVDVVLNRVDSPDYPDSIPEVIFENNGRIWQFTTAGNGALSEAIPTADDYAAVYTELNGERFDDQVLFFSAGGFQKCCMPLFQHGDHYFGK